MDSQAISQLLYDKLIAYGIITLPGIGTITIEEVPASIAGDEKSITPPQKQIRFTPDLSLLAEPSEMARQSAPAETASHQEQSVLAEQSEMAEAATELCKILSAQMAAHESAQGTTASPEDGKAEQEVLELKGFGRFEIAIGKSIDFTPDAELVRQCNLYSFEPIVLELQDDKFIFAAPADATPEVTTQAPVEVEAAATAAAAIPAEVAAPAAEAVPTTAESAPAAEAAPAEEETAPAAEAAPAEEVAAPAAEAVPTAEAAAAEVAAPARKSSSRRLLVILIAAAVLLLSLLVVYLFREELKPILEKLFYSQQELEVLKHFN